jgi:pole hole protein
VRFAGYQNPPGIYLSEYDEWTQKLHRFLTREQSIRERLADLGGETSNGADELASSPFPGLDVLESPPPQDAGSAASPRAAPRSPYRAIVRAHLGNHGRTSVPVKQGVTLRDALSRAMKLRKLTPETCAVYRCRDSSKTPIHWDTDMAALEGEEVRVEETASLPVTTRISHNFVRKTFFSLAFCECCRRLLFQGFCCRTCGFKFHQKCSPRVPTLCQQVRMQKILAAAMLAGDPGAESMVGIIMPGSRLGNHDSGSGNHGSGFVFPPSRTRQINTRDRSSSAPNVCNVIGEGIMLPESYRAPLQPGAGGLPGMVRMADHVSPTTSPTQGSSRSESSSPTSARPGGGPAAEAGDKRRPSRASSADGSSKNEVRQNRDKGEKRETIEDWEIPIDDIFIGPRIGAGSFGDYNLDDDHRMTLTLRNGLPRPLARRGRDQDPERARPDSRADHGFQERGGRA